MPAIGELTGQMPRRLRGPHQRRHRIPTGLGIHQRSQLRGQARIGLRQPLAATTSSTHPSLGLGDALDLTNPASDGVWMHAGCCRDRLDPAPTHLGGLDAEQQATLTLIQMRTQHVVPVRHQLRRPHTVRHNTTVEPTKL